MDSLILQIQNLPIYLWGDTHGNWDFLINYIEKKSITNVIFLQVGDLGVGFKHNDFDRFNEINEILAKNNCFLYSIRGNHDDPFYFSESFVDNWSNVVLVPDYTVINSNNKNILCIGGALSIDRIPRQIKGRQQGKTFWFRKEQFVYKPKVIEHIYENHTIDVVITHSAPKSFYPHHPKNPEYIPNIVKDFAMEDKKLISDITKEREEFEKLWNQLNSLETPPKLWAYGHFHRSHQDIHENTVIKLLDIDEIWDTNLDR